MKFAIPGEDNPDAPESLRRWNIERRNCYKGFGSFGLTKPPTTPVGVMRPVTPHSRQGCRQNLAARRADWPNGSAQRRGPMTGSGVIRRLGDQ
jgi:hypothetical protein